MQFRINRRGSYTSLGDIWYKRKHETILQGVYFCYNNDIKLLLFFTFKYRL